MASGKGNMHFNTHQEPGVQHIDAAGVLTYALLDTARRVFVHLTDAGIKNITLPNPRDKIGEIIMIEVIQVTAGTLHFFQYDGATDAVGDDASAAGDYVGFISNGNNWLVIADKTT